MHDDPTAWFAQTAMAWHDAVTYAGDRALGERVTLLCLRLSALHLAGQQLPEGGSPPARVPDPIIPKDWPGLGSFDAYAIVREHEVVERWLSDDLLAIHADVGVGRALYAKHGIAAQAWWRDGFERRWGELAAHALVPLHRASMAFRTTTPPRRGPKVPELVRLAPAPAPVLQPFVGVQITQAGPGIEVLAVHPDGPAAGRIQPGDWLLSVDDEPLGGLTLDEVRARLTGAIGDLHRVELYRAEETRTVQITVAARTDVVADHAEARSAPPRGRVVVVRILHPDGAERAASALRVLGCTISIQGDQLCVDAPAALADADLAALLDAGHRAGVWSPG